MLQTALNALTTREAKRGRGIRLKAIEGDKTLPRTPKILGVITDPRVIAGHLQADTTSHWHALRAWRDIPIVGFRRMFRERPFRAAVADLVTLHLSLLGVSGHSYIK